MDSITVKGRKFDFEIPSAWDGCAIFNMLVKHDVPFLPSETIGLKYSVRDMTPDDLVTFLQLCLKYCFEELPGNGKDKAKTPVINENGSFGILDESAPLITKIVSQYIVFFMNWWRAESN